MNKSYQDYDQFARELVAEFPGVSIENTMETDMLSLTPYIYNECSANCRFCSENLVRNGNIVRIRKVCDDYSEKLDAILDRLLQTPLFLSISGKETSEGPDLLRRILEAVARFEDKGGRVVGKVMYSNMSGFAKNMDGLLDILNGCGITRIECSRHHFDENINQDIVRFKKYQGAIEPVWQNDVLGKVIGRVRQDIPVRLVCVLQNKGVHRVDEISDYIGFARALGVKDVVFRELAMFGDSVEKGTTQQYIEDNRVEVMDLLQQLPADRYRLSSITKGYYYFSFSYVYQGNVCVAFEMSDYEKMIEHHSKSSDKLHKLIFYPNGMLCKDWNMMEQLDWV
ncbi:MAG: hypothetical protein IJU23_11895 [Proteobacteria bacterium]|nr:hypothetical protein [Pseudomonadota bacterium]